MKIRLDQIKSSPRPVRTSWDEEAMDELAQSIREQGVIVPIKVRPNRDGYEIVYGHRRVEASRRAGKQEIEAIVEGVDDTTALVQALIENVQREDLGPLDKARALRMLIAETEWSQQEIARQGLMSGQQAGDLLRLLAQPEDIQDLIEHGRPGPGGLSEGKIGLRHTILVHQTGIEDDLQAQTLRKAANEGLSGAQAQAIAKTIAKTRDPERRKTLLDTPYNPFIHKPEYAEINEHADHITKPTAAEQWANAPEVAVVLEQIKKLREAMRLSAEAIGMGKASPEAKRFVGNRLIQLGKELVKRGEELKA